MYFGVPFFYSSFRVVGQILFVVWIGAEFLLSRFSCFASTSDLGLDFFFPSYRVRSQTRQLRANPRGVVFSLPLPLFPPAFFFPG